MITIQDIKDKNDVRIERETIMDINLDMLTVLLHTQGKELQYQQASPSTNGKNHKK